MLVSMVVLGLIPAMATDLPVGSSPAPLNAPHFPDPIHAFVWRNWQLVPAERMAAVVGARRDDIVRMGRAMGLAGPPRISADQWNRSHITIIRRNWHLLPYEQLLSLLGWDAPRLAYTLREDDFLYVKLGNLKPKCEPLVYRPPTDAVRDHERWIASVVKEELPKGVGALHAPLFGFVRELASRPQAQELPAADNPGLSPRFCYSYFGLYGDPLLEPANDPYPSGYLARLKAAGVDGVWLQGVLSKLSPFPWQPELSEGHERRLESLRRLVSRARKQGIRVYLYLNEPRAMPLSFYAAHPDLRGVTEGDHAALCTGNDAVREYIAGAVEAVARAVPDLGGFFTITASENLTNCWSHFQGAKCPRCSQRTGAATVAEVNELVASGVRKAGGRQSVIAWDWGWPDAWAEEAIAKLPAECMLMSVSEWSLPIERGGIASAVGEYSISAVGPGPRALRNWSLAKRRGLRTVAKMQAGTTWEMSATPYLPALGLVAEHADNLKGCGVNGLMLGWTLGGYPSPNLEVVREVTGGRTPAEALRAVAERRYGRSAPAVLQAWTVMSTAFRQFPYDGGVVYNGPQHMGPANLLWAQPTGYRATMVGLPYDDLDGWRSIYPADVFVRLLRAVALGFEEGATILEQAAQTGNALANRETASEARIARACALHFASAANQARFVQIRDHLKPNKPDSSNPSRSEVLGVLRDEMANARRLYELQTSDPRIGFEASNQYYYVPLDLAEKILNCRRLLDAAEGRDTRAAAPRRVSRSRQ